MIWQTTFRSFPDSDCCLWKLRAQWGQPIITCLGWHWQAVNCNISGSEIDSNYVNVISTGMAFSRSIPKREEDATETNLYMGGFSSKSCLHLFNYIRVIHRTLLIQMFTSHNVYLKLDLGKISSAGFWSTSLSFNIQASKQQVLIVMTNDKLLCSFPLPGNTLVITRYDRWQSEPTE